MKRFDCNNVFESCNLLFKLQIIVLAIAYHNMGVEEEFMENLDKALNWHEKSINMLVDNQIMNDSLLKKFRHAHEVAKNVKRLLNLLFSFVLIRNH